MFARVISPVSSRASPARVALIVAQHHDSTQAGQATMSESDYDVVVVGSGPNGLAAAVTLAEAGLLVLVLEAKAEPGGGTRSLELTEPGFVHDVCSAIHPMGVGSPFFRARDFAKYGLSWCQPQVPLAHALTGDKAVALHRNEDKRARVTQLAQQSMYDTARALGADRQAYERLLSPLTHDAERLMQEMLAPIRFPRRPLRLARFGYYAVQSCTRIVGRFISAEAKALFAGCAAHAAADLQAPGTAAFALMLLAAGHAFGWPCARGGSRSIYQALVAYLTSLGGRIQTESPVRSLAQLPAARVVILNLTPRQIVEVAADHLPAGYVRRLQRYRYGPGAFKIDWALHQPIPWRAGLCRQAGTVHVGDSFAHIAAYEQAVAKGNSAAQPFVLVAQPSLFDDSRAPASKHTGWAYCHVPHGSSTNMTEAIESAIELRAPGFRDCIIARHTMTAQQLELYNGNLVGGDIGGGANDLMQIVGRPALRLNPYRTPNERIFLASSATPPGGGVHGMSGYLAAKSVLRHCFGRS